MMETNNINFFFASKSEEEISIEAKKWRQKGYLHATNYIRYHQNIPTDFEKIDESVRDYYKEGVENFFKKYPLSPDNQKNTKIKKYARNAVFRYILRKGFKPESRNIDLPPDPRHPTKYSLDEIRLYNTEFNRVVIESSTTKRSASANKAKKSQSASFIAQSPNSITTEQEIAQTLFYLPDITINYEKIRHLAYIFAKQYCKYYRDDIALITGTANTNEEKQILIVMRNYYTNFPLDDYKSGINPEIFTCAEEAVIEAGKKSLILDLWDEISVVNGKNYSPIELKAYTIHFNACAEKRNLETLFGLIKLCTYQESSLVNLIKNHSRILQSSNYDFVKKGYFYASQFRQYYQDPVIYHTGIRIIEKRHFIRGMELYFSRYPAEKYFDSAEASILKNAAHNAWDASEKKTRVAPLREVTPDLHKEQRDYFLHYNAVAEYYNEGLSFDEYVSLNFTKGHTCYACRKGAFRVLPDAKKHPVNDNQGSLESSLTF